MSLVFGACKQRAQGYFFSIDMIEKKEDQGHQQERSITDKGHEHDERESIDEIIQRSGLSAVKDLGVNQCADEQRQNSQHEDDIYIENRRMHEIKCKLSINRFFSQDKKCSPA